MSDNFKLSAGGIVCRREGEQLWVAMIATHGGERWALPKGAVEPGESLEEAALREVREETGLEAEIVAALQPIEYWFWWGPEGQRVRYRKKVRFFIMAYRGGTLRKQASEVDDVRWFPLDEALQRASYITEQKLLRQVKERQAILLNREQ